MRVSADDLADFSLADGLDGDVHDERLCHEAKDAPQSGARAVEHGGGADDGDVDGKERLADLNVGAAAQDHGKDVGAARRRAYIEDERAAERGKKDRKAHVEREVARDGRLDGNEPLEQRDVGGKRDRGERAPQDGAAIEEHEAERHEEEVQNPHERRDGHLRKERREHDGDARGAAEGQVVGRLEDDDGERREDEAEVEHAEERQLPVAGGAALGHLVGAPALLVGLVLADRRERVPLVGGLLLHSAFFHASP